MDQAKTQSVSVSNKNPQILLNKTRNFNSFTTKQMKTIQTELPVESKTLKGQFCDVAKEAKDTRKIAHINPYYSYFPHFYVKELKNAFITYITCLILFFGVLGLLI
jgi:flagellar biosynthesis protein FliP